MSETVDDVKLFTRTDGVETAPLQQDAIVYHPVINRFCILNRTSSFIWNRLERPVSPIQLASDVARTFAGVSETEALDDVRNTLSKFLELNLIVPHNA